jgi:hypothetical protein
MQIDAGSKLAKILRILRYENAVLSNGPCKDDMIGIAQLTAVAKMSGVVPTALVEVVT